MRKITLGELMMAAILILGFSVRLLNLGDNPLSDYEAGAALRAWFFSENNIQADPGFDPGYAALTGFLFFTLGATNFLARLLPALAGGLLPLVPFLVRRRIGTVPAVLIALGLAFDPVLVGVSRLAGGPALAAGLLVGAVVLRSESSAGVPGSARRTAAAVLAGIALISGPAVFAGLLGLAFSWATLRAVGQRSENGDMLENEGGEFEIDLRKDVLPFALTVLFAATLFLRYPQGVAAFAGSLQAFISGWSVQNPVPFSRIMSVLLAYHAVPLLFAVMHIWTSWRKGWAAGRFLSIWFVSSLLLLAVYPGRQVIDLIWPLIPLWGLAGLEIGRYPIWHSDSVYRPATLAAAIVVLTISFWTNLAAYSYVPFGDPQTRLRLLIMAGTLLLALLSIALAALGWHPRVALSGTIWGILAAVLFGMVSGIWGNSQRSTGALRELWFPGALPGEAALLLDTLDLLGNHIGFGAESLEIVSQVAAPSMTWALRDLDVTTSFTPISGEELPHVIITETGALDSRLESAYRGQGLAWQVTPVWELMTRQEWLKWWLFREGHAATSDVVVWARADLFFSGSGDTADLFPLDAIEEPREEELIPLEDVEELFPDS